MATTILDNPFLVYGYEGPEYFCDRVAETEKLISNLRNGWNVTLVSPRRMGKTGLIKHAFYQLQQEEPESVCIYIDIFGTNSLHDFVQTLGTAMLNAMFSKSEKLLQKVMQLFSAWRPVLSADPLTGAPSLSVTLEPTQTEFDLKTIFDYLKSSGKQVYLAIDEFQQIDEYPEKGTEALLRSYIQFIHNVHFIFSGSKQHLMTDMFMSPRRPFYQSTWLMDLEPIAESSYYAFAAAFFQKKGGSLSQEAFHDIYSRMEGHTWYIQTILKVLYATAMTVGDSTQVTQAIQEIINTNASYYASILPLLPEKQRDVVKAIAAEGVVTAPTAGAFIHRYHLKSASTMKSAIDALVNKEIIYHHAKGYMVYDRFFAKWLKVQH